MWELGYITHRSAKWRNYLVGQFGSVYEHRISSAQSLARIPKEAGGKRGHRSPSAHQKDE